MDRRTETSLFLAIAAIFCGFTIHSSAQANAGGGFQSNQIGPNAFVSSPNGEVYLVLNNQLYHNTKDSWDSWDHLASNMKAVALDPRNEKVIYGITNDNRVQKSLDGGQKWLTLDTGFSNAPLSTIYVNPIDSQEVLVGSANGLLKTTDAGFSWHPTSFVFAVNQIVIDSHTPSARYLLSSGSIFASNDGGATWRKSESGLPTELVRGTGRTASKVVARASLLISVDWGKPFLLAATNGKGVVRSDDNGVSWKPTGSGLDLSETFVTASVGKQRVVLSSSDHLYRSTDGMSWSRINVRSGKDIPISYMGVIEHPKRDGLLLHFRFPQDGEIENVGAKKRVGFLDGRDVLVGLNYGVLRHSEVDGVWTSTLNGKPALFSVTSNLFDVDQVESATRPVFSYLSTDNGYSWELIGKPECGELANKPGGSPSEVWVFGSGACITRTQDGGLTWGHMPGVDTSITIGSMTTIEFDPKNHNIAYYSGRGIGDSSIYRYQYSPETKQGQSVNLKTIATDVLIDESNQSDLFNDTAQLSTDGGWTWVDKSRSLAKTCKCEEVGVRYFGPIKLLSFRSGEIRTLIAYNGNAFNGYPGDIAVVRSQDSGENWNIISKLEAHKLLAGPFINPDDRMNGFIAALTAPKGTPGAFGSSYRPDTVRVLETKDGGATWSEIYKHPFTGLAAANGLIHGVAQFKQSGGRTILLATSEGLLRSEDEGRTWTPLGGLR